MGFRAKGLALLLTGGLASSAMAAEGGGNLLGWVEDSRGLPVPGVLISAFTQGMRDGGFVTVSDAAGRFFLRHLPPGSYTIRAVGPSHRPVAARQITVLPNQDSIFEVSLRALEDLADAQVKSRASELTWLERHKRRSVLEDRVDGPAEAQPPMPEQVDLAEQLSPWLSTVSGTVELMADSTGLASPSATPFAEGLPGGSGVVRFEGKITDAARFTLGGLVAESAGRSWRMAAEFVLEPGGGHEVQVGAGYGSRVRDSSLPGEENLDEGGVGALFVHDRWELSDRLAVSGGVRHSYVGFVARRNYDDPVAAVEFSPDSRTRLRGSLTSQTLSPGGDMLRLSTLSTALPIAYASADPDLTPQRTRRYELAVARHVGQMWIEARTFDEETADRLVNVFSGPRNARLLQITNGGDLSVRGVGVQVSQSIGRSVQGTVTYTFGASRSTGPETFATPFLADAGTAAFRDGSFHDLAARVESVFDWTDTRLVALYRISMLRPSAGVGSGAVRTSRFDFQLSQGLPFIGALTRAEWDLLFAVRNSFYETADGGTLDEMAVVNPPKRVMGGIAVRF